MIIPPPPSKLHAICELNYMPHKVIICWNEIFFLTCLFTPFLPQSILVAMQQLSIQLEKESNKDGVEFILNEAAEQKTEVSTVSYLIC